MSTVPQAATSRNAKDGHAAPIDTKLIVPFVNSTRNVFSTMMKVDVKVDYPYLKENGVATFDISGIIGFSGDIIGSVVVSFQTQSAIKLVEAFSGTLFAADSTDFADAIGELANMIAGSAKQDLGLTANITVPTVIIGSGHSIARLSGVPCIVIPCKTAIGNFAVEVNIKPAK